jgi:ferrochelatase
MKANIGVLLLNLGTPDSPTSGKVKKYLTQFLNDPRVIDINRIGRFFLVNGIIIPFRTKGSTKIYKEVWDEKKGSPLLFHTKNLSEKVQEQLGDNFHVEYAMRYQKPSTESVLERMQKMNFKQLIVLPLYPQYASSSTGTALEEVMRVVKKWWVIPELSLISQFNTEAGYIDTIVERTAKYKIEEYDHIIFSYHGLPIRHVDKVYEDGECKSKNCEDEATRENQFCYKANCYETTRLLAEKLNLKEEQYTVAFQSRLNEKWLEPFADQVVIEKAKSGAKKLLIFSPAFAADCLETLIEIGGEYNELFQEHGGELVQLVESLNDHPLWVNTVAEMVKKRAML